MEEDLFTFTAYHGGEPFYTHQGVPGYNSTSKFKCLCGQSKIEVPHNMITTPTGIPWRCKLPWNMCGRRYTFRLDYPDHVLHADESIKDKMDRMERSIQLVLRSLQQQQTQAAAALILRQDPIRDALVRQEDPIAALQRAYRQHQQPEDAIQLREDISDAFQRLDERMWSVEESLDSLNDRAEDAVRKAERTLRHVRAIEGATKGNGDVLQGLQEEVGAIGNLGHMIQQINHHDGFAQLQPTLFAISQSLQQLHAVIGPMAATRDAVRDIQEQLNKYNKRYDKSIGVIIG